MVADLIEPYSLEPIVRFRVTNVSGEAVTIKADSLPWNDDLAVSMTGIALSGKPLPIVGQAGSRLISEEPPMPLAAGASLIGKVPLKYLYGVDRQPRNQDVLLLWSYRHGEFRYTGILHLPRK